jgi:hypothetical protein
MFKAQVTPLGAAGSASATSSFQSSSPTKTGKLYAVYLDYAGVTSTTDVTVKLSDPSVAIFTRSNSASDGWFFPRFVPASNTASHLSLEADAAGNMPPIAGDMVVNVAQSTQVTNGVTVYAYVEED